MTIILTGGGSGGHITPLLAVAHELKGLQPDVKLIYIGQRGDSLSYLPAQHPDIDQVFIVRAGKFRRYSGQGLKQLVDIPTIYKNIRDISRVSRGYFESRRLLRKIRPDIIFIKGGFVGVPVGLAAAKMHIPFITHDSDSAPGLANRIISRWAKVHAVALSKENYPYPPDKTFSVGVPIKHDFVPITPQLQQQYREELGLSKFKHIIFVTGGGNGAAPLNGIVARCSPLILSNNTTVGIVHIAGKALIEETEDMYKKVLSSEQINQVTIKGFEDKLYLYSGAADVVIGRGSATNLAEFAMQGKACVIVPARQLPWTVHNTLVLAKDNAVISLDEDDLIKTPDALARACNDLLASPEKRSALGNQLSNALVHKNAARELAILIIDNADKEK
jgi:UDP-N-acetylglucosamine--N-acetylmuramyl-(pentapeptide) pyrophosphoryl-undecaprenol N-acetylglucosamine transferase